MKKQKLQGELKNVPKDAPQVLCSTSLSLNKEETLSATGIVLPCHNPEVDLPQHTVGYKAAKYVFVRSLEGLPLMSCTNCKAKKLLKGKKAHVVKLYPFTIQLVFACENQVQDVTFGEDSGYGNIGFSAVTSKKELASGTLILDGKTSERLTEKKMYRRLRRNKHHWYRKPRFQNRKKKEGWLPPSVQRRYDTHLTLIKRYKAVLPITKVRIEVGNFDIQKLENDEIIGIDYQQSDLYGYQNMRSYLMARENGKCQLCGGEFGKGKPSHIHHCLPRSEKGSNKAKNLAILHKKCHIKLHKKGLKLAAPKTYRPNTFMSIIHKKFQQDLPDVEITFGYVTFVKRCELGLDKTHYNDAFVIAGGTTQERCEPVVIRQKHRNNRALQLNRKGFAPSIRRQRYAIQPKDLVWIEGKKRVAKGVRGKGNYVMIQNIKKDICINIKNIKRVYNFGSFAYS